jgi:hypothetical protein
VQSVPQLIPDGLLVTVPPPLPDFETVNTKPVAGGVVPVGDGVVPDGDGVVPVGGGVVSVGDGEASSTISHASDSVARPQANRS